MFSCCLLLVFQINEQEWRDFSPSNHITVVLGSAKCLTRDLMPFDFGRVSSELTNANLSESHRIFHCKAVCPQILRPAKKTLRNTYAKRSSAEKYAHAFSIPTSKWVNLVHFVPIKRKYQMLKLILSEPHMLTTSSL